jgi:DNA-binding MarR family transcriptional regulator
MTHGVTDPARERMLKKFASRLSRETPARAARAQASELDIVEVEFLAEGLAMAQRALRSATDGVTERYDLGPRGAWILNVISNGVAYPLELASIFNVGRSLITAELVRLTDAGLVATRPNDKDRRKTELTLTPLGRAASDEVRGEFAAIVRRRLAAYDSAEVRLMGEMLRAVNNEPVG